MKEPRCPRCGGPIIEKRGDLQCLTCGRILVYGDGSAPPVSTSSENSMPHRPRGQRGLAKFRTKERLIPLFDERMNLISRVPDRLGSLGVTEDGRYYISTAVDDSPWARIISPPEARKRGYCTPAHPVNGKAAHQFKPRPQRSGRVSSLGRPREGGRVEDWTMSRALTP